MKDPSFWLGIGGLAVAALTLILNFFIEIYRSKKQLELKKYEVEFLERRKSFVEFFRTVRRTTVIIRNPKFAGQDLETLSEAMQEQYAAIYGLMPFLPVADHDWARGRATELDSLLNAIWYGSPSENKERVAVFERLLETVRKELFSKLFGAQEKSPGFRRGKV
jgi:hypothetical protein